MDKMRVRTIVVLLFAMLLARPVWAQQQTVGAEELDLVHGATGCPMSRRMTPRQS